MEPDPITQPYAQIVGKHGEPMIEERWIPRQELDPVQVETRAFRLCGVKSPYFTAALWSPGGETAPRVRWAKVDVGSADPADDWQRALGRLADLFKERGRPVAKEPNLGERLRHCAQTWHRPWVELEVPVGSADAPAEAARLHVYAGPLSRRILAQDRYRGDNSGHFSGILTYPFAFDFLAKFLLFIFDLWNGITGSTGLAVILMTFVVRGGLMPISIRNQVSMRKHGRKMARLKPKIEQLKARFGKDPKRFREEQMKLFKEHNVGFPAGCLLLLLQIPIFFALFSCLRVEYDLRQQAFAWISDLSGPDRLIDFGLSSALLPFPPGGIWGLNLLPVLYMALSIYQQSLMPKPTDPQQASQMKMAKWMTIIFPILLYNYTAALALYMCVSSTVAIFESLVVRRHDAHHIAKENAEA
jgi:YidC/Oxa1 family membrane protein insertase